MGKRRPNQETIQDGDKEVSFVADFGFLVELNEMGRDVAFVFQDLASGLMPPAEVKNVLVCAIEHGGEEEVIDIINRYGLQECSILARLLLSHALIGDIKKSQVSGMEKNRTLLDSLIPSRWENLRKLGWLWMAITASSTALVCLIFSYYGLRI